MKYLFATIALVTSAVITHHASAQKQTADDVKWINQCVDDNKAEPGATLAIAQAYCTCMNEKMDNNESRSISQWEKTHRKERDACSKQAGWR